MRVWAAAIAGVWLTLAADSALAAEAACLPLDVEACVQLAVGHGPAAERARAQMWQHEARLRQVEASLYPKLTATGFLAPAYTVRGGGFDEHPITRYKSIRDWGPYTNLEARVVQGVYGFGRYNAAHAAARERMLSEQANVRQTEQEVARQVRRVYFASLFAKTLLAPLQEADALVAHIMAQAERVGTPHGAAAAELGRLVHGQSELRRRLDQAVEGAHVGQAALHQLVGLAVDEPLCLADERLPMPPVHTEVESDKGALSPTGLGAAGLAPQLALAFAQRPEFGRLAHGQAAAVALERAERGAMLPRLLLVGQFNTAWTPTRDRDTNPWHYDIYNRLAGGLALVLQVELDVAQAQAKAREAAMLGAELRALQRLAQTGIPVEVREAFEGLRRARADLKVSEQDVIATRRWLQLAKSAVFAGTGEPREMLEGLVASLEARHAHLAAANLWWQKLADLAWATGAKRLPVLPKSSAAS